VPGKRIVDLVVTSISVTVTTPPLIPMPVLEAMPEIAPDPILPVPKIIEALPHVNDVCLAGELVWESNGDVQDVTFSEETVKEVLNGGCRIWRLS